MVTHPAMTLKGHLAADNVAGSGLQLMIMEGPSEWFTALIAVDDN